MSALSGDLGVSGTIGIPGINESSVLLLWFYASRIEKSALLGDGGSIYGNG